MIFFPPTKLDPNKGRHEKVFPSRLVKSDDVYYAEVTIDGTIGLWFLGMYY